MEKRIKRLELQEEDKNIGMIVLEKESEDAYIYWQDKWNKKGKKVYTRKEVDKLQEHNRILIVVWAEANEE